MGNIFRPVRLFGLCCYCGVICMVNKILTDEIKQRTLERLNKHVKENYIGRHDVRDVTAKFKGRYLYINWVEGLTDEKIQELIADFKKEVPDEEKVEQLEKILRLQLKNSIRRPSKLCRIRYTGNEKSWDFQIYKYSDNWYDVEGDFSFSGGSVEECFDAAASLYITETFLDD